MSRKTHLSENVAKLRNGTIPDKVAQITRQDQNYLISFKHYREDLCEIDLLEKNRPKECIQVFKRASQATLGKLNEKGIDHIPIQNSGEYKKLFNSTLQVFMGRSRLREPLRRNFISQDRLEYAFLRNKITSKGALSARGAHKNLQSRDIHDQIFRLNPTAMV